MKSWNKFLFVIFAGSVFITSGKFVNAINASKYYFVVAILLVVTLITAINKRRIKLGVSNCKTMLWYANIICFLQACIGLFQFVGWLHSNHTKYAITGSFDNPAGFAAVLSLGFPIGLFLLKNGKIVEKYLAGTVLVLVAIAVFISGSRTGIMAIIISTFVSFGFRIGAKNKFRKFIYFKLLPVLILGITMTGVSILYHLKKDSANGRLLIWRISSEMIKDKPLIGHGHGAFQTKYMDYQAEYFKHNPNSKFKLLADNVKHPFNEFIKIAVECGLIGLMVVISLLFLIIWKIIKSKNDNKTVVLSGLVSFLVFAAFRTHCNIFLSGYCLHSIFPS
jgi:O-antigen polymerase